MYANIITQEEFWFWSCYPCLHGVKHTLLISTFTKKPLSVQSTYKAFRCRLWSFWSVGYQHYIISTICSLLPRRCRVWRWLGESGHPLFISMVLVITSESPLEYLTHPNTCLCSAHIAHAMSEGILSAWSLHTRHSLVTKWKTLLKSTKHPHNHFFCAFAWFTKQHYARMWLVVEKAQLNSAWHGAHISSTLT